MTRHDASDPDRVRGQRSSQLGDKLADQLSDRLSGQRSRLLVVDDERLNCTVFKRYFKGAYDVTMALSAEAALAILLHQDFDVAFVDFNMTGMDGVDFARRAHELRPRMTRVLVTGDSTHDKVLKAKADGVVHGVVAKPWAPEDIEPWTAYAAATTATP